MAKCKRCGKYYDVGVDYMCWGCYQLNKKSYTKQQDGLFTEEPSGQIKAILDNNETDKQPK